MAKLGRPFKGIINQTGRECTKCGEFKLWGEFPKTTDNIPSRCLVCCRGVSSREKRAWLGMKQRCLNPKTPGFKNWGGRGIKICKGLLDFNRFLEILGPCPEKFTLDRKDNEKHYSCGTCEECISKNWKRNVRWTTRTIQANNRRYRSIAYAMTLEGGRIKSCITARDRLNQKGVN